MFDFWYDLPTLFRALFGLVLLGVAALIFFASGGTRIAVGLGATGLVMLLFSGAGNDKSGYNF
jgi:hypothetical protein